MPTVRTADGCEIAYDVGAAGTPVLLIPGLGGSGTFWSPVTASLGAGFRWITFDHRGTGRSGRPLESYSIERIAADAVSVLDDAGFDKAHVVGHSTGGVVAQVLALDHAARVDRLVLSGSWARFDERMALLFGARAEVLEAAGPRTYQRLTHALGFPAEWIAGHRAELEQAVAEAPAALSPIAVALERIRMLARTDRSAELCDVATPTLVIGAPDDPMIPFYQSERLASSISGARLKRLAGSHFFPRVHPGRFAGMLRNFWGGTGDG